ncbi:MAG TPA: ABC transporter transmembrane domain-containing protein [Arthrobacter sp.]|nr:ABC transporter transmembrane domain-containing protein [Arthrobacter sp.]
MPRKNLPPGLPKLLSGRRRGLMALLVATGLAMAAVTGTSALLMMWLLEQAPPIGGGNMIPLVAGLAVAALAIGGLRALERVLGEMLGQDYIHQIRKGLVKSALATDRGPSPGVTIARSTNDLSSVRNWIAMGIAPLAVGVPLILGTAVALWLLAPGLALAVVVPLTVLAAGLALMARPAFERARTLRRQRGRLAARLADTVMAARTIRAAGGEAREVKQVDKAGRDVVDAAVHRAAASGCIRGAAAAAASLGTAAVAAVGSWQAIPTATVAAALTIVGMIAAPITDMGRAVEYRQNFKAARRILGPALAVSATEGNERRRRVAASAGHAAAVSANAAGAHEGASNGEALQEVSPDGDDKGSLLVAGLSECRNCPVPELQAWPGQRIRIRSADPAVETRLLETLIGVCSDPDAFTQVNGMSLLDSSARDRRRLVGYAAAGAYLERGSIARSVRYRRPDLAAAEGSAALDRVGLAGPVARLERGEQTMLKRGGEPLSTSERARLVLARATLGEPPVLVVNRLDSDLDRDGRDMLATVVRDYPGIVLFASDDPDALAVDFTEWSVDCPHAGLDLTWVAASPAVVHDAY